MKRSAILISFFSILLIPSVAYAEVHVSVSGSEGSSSVNVQSESSGTSTVCQNGKCTTTGGESKSTVCINGKCTTSTEDVNYQSEDGNTKVTINNNETNTQATPTTEARETATPTEQQPTITINPIIEKAVKEVEAKAEEVEEKVKQRVKNHDSVLNAFIKEELESLQKLLGNLF